MHHDSRANFTRQKTIPNNGTFLGSTSPELRLAETVAVKAPVASRKGLRVAAGGDGRASNVWMVLKG